MNFKLFDHVRLRWDRPEENLKKGMTGAIVEIHEVPSLAYEVEFVAKDGRTLALLALQPNEIELVR